MSNHPIAQVEVESPYLDCGEIRARKDPINWNQLQLFGKVSDLQLTPRRERRIDNDL